MQQSDRHVTHRGLVLLALLALVVPVMLLSVACGGDDEGLSRAEVEEIVRAEIAESPPPPTAEPGLTSADVEEAIRAALADMPQPESGLSSSEVEEIVKAALADIPQSQPGLTSAESERIARGVVASIPPKSAPAEYTKFFVENAISRYETQGLDATLAYYNREESIDGQWYVFIIDENDLVIGHPDAYRLGLDLRGWVGTDANGYNFGPDILSATEEGKWVSYVYQNPEDGGIASGDFIDIELKNVWVVRQEGLLFASGWYIDADDFTKLLVSVALDTFRSGGLKATVEYFARPESVLAGLEAAISYYNQAKTIDGKWSAFIADEDGKIVAHSDPTRMGVDIQELFGTSSIEATEEGNWMTTDAVRMWVAESEGFLFGSGWHHDQAGG